MEYAAAASRNVRVSFPVAAASAQIDGVRTLSMGSNMEGNDGDIPHTNILRPVDLTMRQQTSVSPHHPSYILSPVVP